MRCNTLIRKKMLKDQLLIKIQIIPILLSKPELLIKSSRSLSQLSLISKSTQLLKLLPLTIPVIWPLEKRNFILILPMSLWRISLNWRIIKLLMPQKRISASFKNIQLSSKLLRFYPNKWKSITTHSQTNSLILVQKRSGIH